MTKTLETLVFLTFVFFSQSQKIIQSDPIRSKVTVMITIAGQHPLTTMVELAVITISKNGHREQQQVVGESINRAT